MIAIVVTFDSLRLDSLGCYGSQWDQTPYFDRLAAESVTFDQHFSVDALAGWTRDGSFWSELSSAGVGLTLVSEEGSLLAAEASRLERDTGATCRSVVSTYGLSMNESDMPFARLTALVDEELARSLAGPHQNSLLWIGSVGVPEPWLPPRPYGCLYLEDVDRLPNEIRDAGNAILDGRPLRKYALNRLDHFLTSHASSHSPEQAETADAITDEDNFDAWCVRRAVHAGFVSVLDKSFGRLYELLCALLAGREWMLIVTAAEGRSLGGDRLSANPLPKLREETVHTPLWIRTARPEEAHWLGGRRQQLAHAGDLPATVLDGFGIELRAAAPSGLSWLPAVEQPLDGQTPGRDRLLFRSVNGESARTSEFHFVRSAPASETTDIQEALFLKPDDPFEVHDVRAEYPGVCDELRELLTDTDQQVAARNSDPS